MTVREIQEYIFEQTGLKTSVRKGTGSEKGYFQIWPQFQNSEYPKIPFEVCRELKEILKEFDKEPNPVFCSTETILVYGIEDDRKKYKKERKPKEREEMNTRQWGNKNSQMRLDKAAKRYAKNLKSGKTGVRYN